jgi:hypothetical protein
MVEAENIDNAEIIVCPRLGFDQQNKLFAGCTRGLDFRGGSETAVTANKKDHQAGASCNMTNVGQFFNLFGGIYDANIWYYDNTFATTSSNIVKLYFGSNQGAYIWYNTTTDQFGWASSTTEFQFNSGGTTFTAITPLSLLSGELKLNTSTYDFLLRDNLLAFATSTISSGTASGKALEDWWNTRWIATTTKESIIFTNVTSTGNTILGNLTGTPTSTLTVIGNSKFQGNSTTTGHLSVDGQLCFNNGGDCVSALPLTNSFGNTATSTTDLSTNGLSATTTVSAMTASSIAHAVLIGTNGANSTDVRFGIGSNPNYGTPIVIGANENFVWDCYAVPNAELSGVDFSCSYVKDGKASTTTEFIRGSVSSAWNLVARFNLASSNLTLKKFFTQLLK